MLFGLTACGWTVEIVDPTEEPGNPENDKPGITVSEPEENPGLSPEPEAFTASFIKNSDIPLSKIGPTEEFSLPMLVPVAETEMTGEKYEICEKYISPLEKTLLGEFDEGNPLRTGGATYTYLFYSCENLDNIYYGIEKSGCDASENYLVDGRRVEESLGRWFLWNPEDYRPYFEYNAETEEYQIYGCGGGPTFIYVTDYRQEGDILTINFSNYDGWSESDFAMVYSTHEVRIKLEETGWKYLSAKKTSEPFSPNWHNEDYSFGADYSGDWIPGTDLNYYIFGNGERYKAEIGGILAHKLYFGKMNVCLFFTENGLCFYNFKDFYHVSELPSNYEGIHSVKNAWVDLDGNLIIAYVPGSDPEAENPIEIAVMDMETKEIINFIDTLLPGNFNDGELTLGLESEPIEPGIIELYDTVANEHREIKYLE